MHLCLQTLYNIAECPLVHGGYADRSTFCSNPFIKPGEIAAALLSFGCMGCCRKSGKISFSDFFDNLSGFLAELFDLVKIAGGD